MASIFLFKGQEDRKMSFRSDWKQLTFKDKMDILEALFTIVVSIIALWGTFTAIENVPKTANNKQRKPITIIMIDVIIKDFIDNKLHFLY